jgi:hypothetical protein
LNHSLYGKELISKPKAISNTTEHIAPAEGKNAELQLKAAGPEILV